MKQLDLSYWGDDLEEVRHALDVHVLGGTKPRLTRLLKDGPESPTHRINFSPEPGIRLTAAETLGEAPRTKGRVIFLSLDGEVKMTENKLAAALQQSGHTVLSLSLRAPVSTPTRATPSAALRTTTPPSGRSGLASRSSANGSATSAPCLTNSATSPSL